MCYSFYVYINFLHQHYQCFPFEYQISYLQLKNYYALKTYLDYYIYKNYYIC